MSYVPKLFDLSLTFTPNSKSLGYFKILWESTVQGQKKYRPENYRLNLDLTHMSSGQTIAYEDGFLLSCDDHDYVMRFGRRIVGGG